MAEGIEAGDVVWKITGENKSLDKALKNSTRLIKKASTVMIAGGVAIAGAAVGIVKSWANAGDEIQKMALRTGFATETLSELKFAAELSGTSIQSIEKGTKKLAQTIHEAGQGVSTYTDALEGVGLKYEDLAGLSPEEQFLTVAAALADVEDHTKKVALAQEIFGRAGVELLPMLAAGSAGLREMREEARELGIVFSQEDADAAADFNDSLQKLGDGMKGMMFQLGPIIATMATEYLPAIENAIKGGVAWLQNNRELLATWIPIIAKFAAFSLALGLAGKALGPFVALFKVLRVTMVAVTGLKAAGAIAGIGQAALGSSGSVMGLVGALAGPVGLGLAVAGTTFLVWKAVEAFGAMRRAQDELSQGIEDNKRSVNSQVLALQKQGVAITDAELAGLSHADTMKLLKERISEAEAEQQREISALNGVTESLLQAGEKTVKYTGGIWDMNRATEGITTSTDGLTQSLNFTAGAYDRLAQSARQANIAMAGGGGRGSIPSLHTGGMVTQGGAVKVERNEIVLLPAAAEVIPRKQAERGGAVGGGGGLTTGPITVNVSGAAAGLDHRALAAEIGESLYSELRAVGAVVGV